MKVNDTVRIVRDEHEELIGVMARIEKMGPDGTTAWVIKPGAKMGVWCALSHLEVVMCSMHTDQMLVWEDGGPQDITVHGRWYCPECSASLMRALDDAAAGRVINTDFVLPGTKDTLHDLDDVIEAFGFTRAELEADLIFDILSEHVGSATEFCIACPGLIPTRDEAGELPEDRWWIKKHQAAMIAERMDNLLCDALAAGDSTYDARTMKEHIEALIARMREEYPTPRSTRDA
jgi:hypothetical protein